MRRIVIVLVVLSVAALLVFVTRTDPIGFVSGKKLSGEVMAKPSQWPVCDENETLALETRPDDPHSVTIWYFLYRNTLFVPASNPTEKRWPGYLKNNPNVRVKICDKLFAAKARIATSYPRAKLLDVLTDKYPKYRGQDLKEMAMKAGPDDLWVFEIRP